MFRSILFFLIGILPVISFATNKYSVRRCVLLPILHEGKKEKVEKKIFDRIEKYLEEGTWCAYRSSEKTNEILRKYRENLSGHLDNEEVLRSIAERERSGSLIRTKVAKAENGTYVEVEVIGENGRDLLFKERSYAKDLTLKKIYSPVEQITRLLDMYGKNIPYDGRITRIDKKEFSMNVIKSEGSFEGEELIVRRPIRKRINPLMPNAIEWEVKRVGTAKVVAQDKQQIFAKADWFNIQEELRVGDWVSIVKKSKEEKKTFKRIELKSFHEYKKRSTFNFVGVFGYGQTTNLFNTSRRQFGGMTAGATTDFKWWMKNLHLGLNGNIAYRTGFYGKKFGTLSENTVISQEQFFGYKAFLSYRQFTSEFFYGPQIIYSLGYVSYYYKMDYVAADGLTSCQFYGPAISIRGDFPLAMNLRAFLRYEIVPFVGQFQETDTAYGSNPKSVTSSQMELGIQRIMATESALYVSGQWTSNKAKFNSPSQEIHFEDFAMKIGFTLFID